MAKLSELGRFPPEVVKNLRYYVYRLIDPRNGETFYVGKGKGNRVLAHVRGERDRDLGGDELSHKFQRIREIRLAGFEVGHVIHRHGMDSDVALEVESALIDAYPGLTNEVAGTHTADFGSAHADELIRRYSAEDAVFEHRALLISVNRSAARRDLYDATRYAWKIRKSKAEQAEVILATVQGLIIGAFVAHEWLPATAANFPGRAAGKGQPTRWGFVGESAPKSVARLYVHKRVPAKYRKRGASNPVKYTWK